MMSVYSLWSSLAAGVLSQSTQAGAAAGRRAVFEWGRIQSGTDWIPPALVAMAVVSFVCYMYRRDSVELNRFVAVLLTTLRIAAFVGLLLVYLQPQWRHEQDQVTNSRVLLAADTSLSMSVVDNDSSQVPAEPSRAQKLMDLFSSGNLLGELRQRHDVVVYRFDQDLSRVVSLDKVPVAEGQAAKSKTKTPVVTADSAASSATRVDWNESLSPRGTETRLGQALKQLIEDERSAPLSGLVLFTDGQQNAGLEPSAVLSLAKEARVPLFAVGIGTDRQPVNVRISDFVAPTRAYPGDKYVVTGFIQAQGMAGKTVRVELLSRDAAAAAPVSDDNAGQIESGQDVTLAGDGEVLAVKFELTPDEIGRRTLRLRVRAPAEDRNTADNHQEVDIEIVDRQTRVLLFAGGPSREYQFLRNQLRRDKDVIVDVLLQTGFEGVSQDANAVLEDFPGTREELYAYDVLVAFDPDWKQLDLDEQSLVEKWVGDQAGGLIVVAGPIFMDEWTQDPGMSIVRGLYPVEFYQRFASTEDSHYGSKEPWPIEFTRDGLDAEFLWLGENAPASLQAWSEFPGVFGYYAVRGAKPAATVYGRFSDPRSGDGTENAVYLAGQFYGSGRVFYMGSGELWRLRSVDEAHFERLYTKMLRFVSQGRLLRGSSRGVLLTERDRYFLGGTVDVRAQLTDARLEPLEAASVNVDLLLPDSTVDHVTLLADPARAGSFRGQFTARKEGVYRLELQVPQSDDERLVHRVQVKVPELERENTQRNDALLTQLTQATGGFYYQDLNAALGRTPGVDPLTAKLRDQSRTITLAAKPELLWDNQWVMFALCGVLCLEWLIRRLAKLA